MNFRKVNNLFGWITGGIATLVYLITMEPTVSFWDCGEFLSCAYKVEVGHSPGAPLFMLIQRMFGLLAGGNVQKVAMMINAWSAVASGLTILFLFWTITHFAKKILSPGNQEPDTNKLVQIIGAGLVGGLAYTFSDTFWFSAVEAEVYATSSLFTAFTFWAILKWEHIADKPYADKWLILIAYVTGLSVGVHLLNLLAIPAVGMVYYYKRYKVTTMNTIIAFVVSCVVLGIVQFGMLQGVPILASKFDLLFVNSFGMPFDSGAIVFIILLVAAMVWAIIYAKRKGNYLLHTGMLCLTFVMIGFMSYLAPIIRSRADVPIDMTNPDNAISLTSYLQREQFGSNPLLYGPDFTSRPVDYASKGDKYARSQKGGKDRYEVVGEKLEQVYDAADKRFFPRIWDNNEQSHVNFYKNYLGLSEGETPTSADNFSFFFNYQVDWMWWRYFMWNYAGRQNDMEGQGEAKNGNWISGIKFVDNTVRGLGDLDQMADGYKNNPARNQLYFLPFILGILGLIYQFNRAQRDGITTMMLFFFTGLAIAIYLNMPPIQPRERDYAFAGSTYAFAIWIGLGVLMITEYLNKAVKGAPGAILATVLCLGAVPALMAAEEWDDHDRSKKTLAWASAYNTLMSCEKNALLFTFGDNDTYPVWYMQEIEGLRPDVRVVNMSLLGIDWYIDQLNYKINDADAIPMIWTRDQYIGDRRNYVRFANNGRVPQDRYFPLADICKFIASDDQQNKVSYGGAEMENFMPTKNFTVPSLSKDELVKRGWIKATDTAGISTDINFTFPKDIAFKDDIAAMNIVASIAAQGWDRPIYFGGGLPGDNYIGMEDYMRLEGTVYRLMPFKTSGPKLMPQEMGSVDLDKSYDLFMNKYKWGNAERNDVYYDEKNRIMFAAYRVNAGRIAGELAAMGKNTEAVAILDKVMASISEKSYFYDATAYYIAIGYYKAGDKAKGAKLSKRLVENATHDINYIMSLPEERRDGMSNDIQRDLSIMNILAQTAKTGGDVATGDAIQKTFDAQLQRAGKYMQMQ